MTVERNRRRGAGEDRTSADRIVILLDGTWQTDRLDAPPSNIVRLRDIIPPKVGEGENATYQHIYYDIGVGTEASLLSRWWGGATGAGLEDAVRSAYRFLCYKYKPGMEIYVFGFSRGAFSARSLVGYINAAGLLRPESCSREMETTAWNFYRTPLRQRIPAEKLALEKLCQDDGQVRISCLGVFDTVGSRGIPGDPFRMLNQRRYGFHDANLSSIVDHAFHALALDERRGHFKASLWSFAFHNNNHSVEQVWFAGAHTDIGGGTESTDLSSIPLAWMLRRIADSKAGSKPLGLVTSDKSLENIVRERKCDAKTLGDGGFAYKLLASLRNGIRTVSQTRPHGDMRFVGLPKYAKPMKEAIHWSVFERMKSSDYKPPNITSDVIETVIVDNTEFDTGIVGRNEYYLEWWNYAEDYDEVKALLPDDMLQLFNKHWPPPNRMRNPKSVKALTRKYSRPTQ